MIKKVVFWLLIVIIFSSNVLAVSVKNKPDSVQVKEEFYVTLEADSAGWLGCSKTVEYDDWYHVEEDGQQVECRLIAPEEPADAYTFYAAEDNNNDGDPDSESITPFLIRVEATDYQTQIDITAPPSASPGEEFDVGITVTDDNLVDYFNLKVGSTILGKESCGAYGDCTKYCDGISPCSKTVTVSFDETKNFEVIAYDELGNDKPKTFTITISNQAPSIGELSPQEAVAEQEYEGKVKVWDEEGDEVKLKFKDESGKFDISSTTCASGSSEQDPCTFDITAQSLKSKNYFITIKAQDDYTLLDKIPEKTFEIKVSPACVDSDSDGFFGQEGCGTPVDCNDNDPEIYPGAEEECDGVDSNCNDVPDVDERDDDGNRVCDCDFIKSALGMNDISIDRAGREGKSEDVEGALGESVAFVAGKIGDIDFYEWHFGDGSVERGHDLTNPGHAYHSEGTYEVKLKAYHNGCEETDTISVKITECRLDWHCTQMQECVEGKCVESRPEQDEEQWVRSLQLSL